MADNHQGARVYCSLVLAQGTLIHDLLGQTFHSANIRICSNQELVKEERAGARLPDL